MEYTFPKADAMQCIPEFDGSLDELEAFVYHIEHFAREIPEGVSHAPLVYIILLKLKGRAAAAIH